MLGPAPNPDSSAEDSGPFTAVPAFLVTYPPPPPLCVPSRQLPGTGYSTKNPNNTHKRTTTKTPTEKSLEVGQSDWPLDGLSHLAVSGGPTILSASGGQMSGFSYSQFFLSHVSLTAHMTLAIRMGLEMGKSDLGCFLVILEGVLFPLAWLSG